MVKEFINLIDFSQYIDICRKHFFFSYEVITETIIWSITHMLSEKTRDILTDSKLFNDIMKLLKKDVISINLIDTLMWFFSVFFKIKIFPPSFNICKEIIKKIYNLIDLDNTNILINSAWTISYILEFPCNNIEPYLIETGIINKILAINPTNNTLIMAIASLLGNLLCAEDDLIEVKYFK